MRRLIGCAAGLMIACTSILAADLPSAREVLKKAQAPASAPAAADDPVAALKQQIKDLESKVATMPPVEAAAAWLALFDASAEVKPAAQELDESWSPADDRAGVTFDDLLAALPPPPAWEPLAAAVRARPMPPGQAAAREQALRVLADVLVDDLGAARRDGEALARLLCDTDPEDSNAHELLMALARTQQDPLKAFESQLESWQAASRSYPQRLEVPDLVTLAGKERAEALLRLALSLTNVEIEIGVGEETKHLARQVALKRIDTLQTPQWELCYSLDAIELYEAMSKKFSPGQKRSGRGLMGLILGTGGDDSDDGSRFYNDYRRRDAAAYYLLGLVVSGRTDDAVAQVKSLPVNEVSLSYGALGQLQEGGHARAVQAFIHRLLSENPDLPLWDDYISLSAKVGRTDQMLATARNAAARQGLDPARQALIHRHLSRALLAADQVDEGVAALHKTIAQVPKQPKDEQVRSEALSAAMQVARVGRLLGNKDLVDHGLATASKLMLESGDEESDYPDLYEATGLAELLEDNGQAPQAVELLAKVMIDSARQEMRDYGLSDDREAALALLGVYHRAGRHADVLELLETSPYWGAADLVKFAEETDYREAPASFMAAAALEHAGRTDQARSVLHALLDQNGDYDPAYELLIKIDGPNAIARLDELFARDQFEERPLIWKGTILLSQGNLAEAEKVIRQAIAIDPSDGEQGKGTRMRVYAVLADILERKGDAEQAKVYRGAVKAIRVAEDADDWWEAGLLLRAIARYEQALTHFQDAYCIQSRIALRMAELGQMEKAEEHYRKAYELMPDSFGRVESHCFGCEGAFEGATPRKIAETVFKRLIARTPDKPQLHYLLGYLREQQGRYREAVDPIEKAIELDADYLNAWKQLQDLGRYVYLPADVRDGAALNLLRLDPLSRHVDPDFADMGDLQALWKAAAKAVALRPQKPQSLLALPASAAELAKQSKEAQEQVFISGDDDEPPATPGNYLGRTGVIETIGQIIDASVE